MARQLDGAVRVAICPTRPSGSQSRRQPHTDNRPNWNPAAVPCRRTGRRCCKVSSVSNSVQPGRVTCLILRHGSEGRRVP